MFLRDAMQSPACYTPAALNTLDRHKLISFSLLFAALQLCAGAPQPSGRLIWRPCFAAPALLALDSPSDREFTVETRASATAKHWRASIANDLRTWNCRLVSASYGRINRGSEPGWVLKLRIPRDTPPELFDLSVACNQTAATQMHAVGVSPAFEADFYILHISDEQIVNKLHTDPSGQYWHMVGTWEELKWMQQPINLIHPRFVLVTGDQIDYNGALDQWNNWANWGYRPTGKRTFSEQETRDIERRLAALYMDCHLGYRVPYVEAPGNHDVEPVPKRLAGSNIPWHPISAAFYESTFGPRSYSFRMGDFYVLMHDWTDRTLKAWAARDYQDSLTDPTIKFRVIGQHFITDQAYLPTNCDLMLVGHGHTTATLQSTPYDIYEDGPTFKYGTSGFFSFTRTPDGWRCPQTSAPREVAKDVWPLFTDNGEVKKLRASAPDAMNVTSYAITITNDLPQEFYDGRVRFILPKAAYRSVQNGRILAQYPCFHDTRTALLVKVSIPANGTITVTVPEVSTR